MQFLSYRRLMRCYKARHTRNMSPFTTSNTLHIADHDIERLVMYLESIRRTMMIMIVVMMMIVMTMMNMMMIKMMVGRDDNADDDVTKSKVIIIIVIIILIIKLQLINSLFKNFFIVIQLKNSTKKMSKLVNKSSYNRSFITHHTHTHHHNHLNHHHNDTIHSFIHSLIHSHTAMFLLRAYPPSIGAFLSAGCLACCNSADNLSLPLRRPA